MITARFLNPLWWDLPALFSLCPAHSSIRKTIEHQVESETLVASLVGDVQPGRGNPLDTDGVVGWFLDLDEQAPLADGMGDTGLHEEGLTG
ncbi:hypothetical protein SDC9_192526 [bioreactor metagenome]|uniref:Uncharacterized protein n=1 Tax=bioreactor metagenome TaxID=1076179 RepID=A0A645I3C5_9ZZZZ